MAKANIGIEFSIKESGKRVPMYDVNSDLREDFTYQELLTYTKTALIDISANALREEQAKGFDKNPVLLVDGKANRKTSDVNPLGRIEYIARQNVKEILLAIYREILNKSPAVTGAYKESNVVTFNGVQVANDWQEFNSFLDTYQFNPKDKVRFVNTQPYARKLERLGVTAGKTTPKFRNAKPHEKKKGGTTYRVPNGVYVLTANNVKRKYGKNTYITYELVSGDQIGLVDEPRSKGKKVYRSYVKGATPGKPYFYPSILVYFIESGLTGLGD